LHTSPAGQPAAGTTYVAMTRSDKTTLYKTTVNLQIILLIIWITLHRVMMMVDVSAYNGSNQEATL
jgi:hypothetical protein